MQVCFTSWITVPSNIILFWINELNTTPKSIAANGKKTDASFRSKETMFSSERGMYDGITNLDTNERKNINRLSIT